MKWNASLKAALTGCALLVVAYGAWKAYGAAQLSGFKPTPVVPGQVTLIGVDTSAGYKIVVANDVAQLAEIEDNSTRSGSEDAKNLRRIPIREFLLSLTGDANALGRLTMSLNQMKEEDLVGAAATWKAEDVRKALDGDAALRARLEQDLHCGLDGTPPGEIRLKTLLGGIVIDSPVKVKVPIRGEVKVVEARVQEAYMTKFGRSMEKVVGERFNPNLNTIVGLYRDHASRAAPGGDLNEKVAESLAHVIEEKRLQGFAEKPERLMANATVLINQDHVRGATYREWEGNDRKPYADIEMRVNEDGRMRLWKYSDGKRDFQLMFVVDDVALAAPTITSVLNRREVLLTQLPNRALARRAADALNRESAIRAKG